MPRHKGIRLHATVYEIASDCDVSIIGCKLTDMCRLHLRSLNACNGTACAVQCLRHAQQRRKLRGKLFQASLCLVLLHTACIVLTMIVLLSLANTSLLTKVCNDQRHSIDRCALVPTGGICNVCFCAVLIGLPCLESVSMPRLKMTLPKCHPYAMTCGMSIAVCELSYIVEAWGMPPLLDVHEVRESYLQKSLRTD